MIDYAYIYSHQAETYQRMVQREDYQGNLLPAIQRIADPRGHDVVETGAGTGRLTTSIAPLARSVRAFDLSAHMLSVATARLTASGLTNWQTGVADHRALPVAQAGADILLSGWSVCYLAINGGEAWQAELERGLAGFQRLLRPGGAIIIIETLGTGFERPERYPNLTPYFEYLETHGFQSDWVRTDYRFTGMDEARELVPFFFGEEMLAKIQSGPEVILPECTGLWWKITA